MPDNKKIARRIFEEVWSQGRLELADELASPDLVAHPGMGDTVIHGPGEMKEFITRMRDGFPDVTFTVEDQIADGDKVVTRWTAEATHDGPFLGAEPTGRHGRLTGITIQHFQDGKVVEAWTNNDMLGLLQQLGVTPQTARA